MEQNAELVAYVKQMFAIFETGDVSAIDGILSREKDVLGIGSDPREWWAGDALREAFLTQIPEMHGAGMRFEPGDVQAFSEGTVGWVANQPTVKLPDGGEIPMRFTGVCHREDGAWKMVQFHLSVGAMNEETLGEELTV